ncbi:signal peptide peptidase SppA [Candidatus Colwellia aromaticivorans]|uniref:signal peptide peptidase SppA n=1 Tax=Candidatus Colwellia aromaticivorans TaxID=2267621 RepID=UPI000DF1609D|nr:signal peptide peptidase SppA [Candidatus Colwellia aromaticivorans]
MNKLVNLFKRIVLGLWRLFTLTRSVVLNLIFVVLFMGFIAMLGSDSEQVIVPNESALVLNLVGDLVEQKREINPMDVLLLEALDEKEGKPEVLLADVLDVIAKAKNDDRVQLLVLQLQGLKSTGLSKLQDVGAALIDFKSSGKKIVALGDHFSQDQYYLVSHADDIWLNPQGFMLLDGYGRYQMYFKSALEKLSINQHIFRVGTFKSAVEPFLRDDMSANAKEANALWLNDLWQQYKEDVAKQRGFSVNNFDDSITDLLSKFTNANSSFANYALTNKWVDQLKTRAQMRSDLIDMVGKNKKGDSYNHISFKNYLAATTSIIPIDIDGKSTNKIAVIVAKGTILNGKQKPGTIGGDSTATLLRKARNNDKVKAVVLRVDSPGGSAFASEIIRQEVELLKAAGKPVVASMGTYAASGGYWISAPADKIVAAPSTITGSIGIFGMMMTFEDSLSKLGIHTDGVGTTDIAGFGPTQPLTKGMSQLFQLSINKGYQDFIGLVAENRNMTLAQVDAIAQGRVWSGKKAKELGLVDELGNLTDAIVAAAELAKLDTYDTLLIEKESSSRNKFIQKLMGQAHSIAASGFGFGFGFVDNTTSNELTSLGNENAKPMTRFINQLQAEFSKMNQFNDPQGMYTLCLTCSVQ